MRNLFPILLIAVLSYFACNRTAKTEPTNTKPTEISKQSNSSPFDAAAFDAIVQKNLVPQLPMTSEDSAKYRTVDELVKFADQERGKLLKRKDLTLQLFTDNDNFYYTTQDNKVVEAVLISIKGNVSRRHYFYFLNGRFAFYRHLEWRIKEDSPYAKETTVLFDDNNEIFDVEIRRLDLNPTEGPNRLLNEKFLRPPVDKEALMKEVTTLWAKLVEEIEINEMDAHG